VNVRKGLQPPTSTTELTHSFVWLASLRSAQAVSETTSHGCKKSSTRELLQLAAYTSKIRAAACQAVADCAAHDCVSEVGCNPWASFDSMAREKSDICDLTSEHALSAQNIIRAEVELMTSLCKEFDNVVNHLKASLDEKPCPSEEILRAAIKEAEAFEKKKLSTVDLVKKEKTHAETALKRVLKEKELMHNVTLALKHERLGPAESLPPGTSISTSMLEGAIKEANLFGITHPNDQKSLMHSRYMVRLRRTVKEVVVFFKRWRPRSATSSSLPTPRSKRSRGC